VIFYDSIKAVKASVLNGKERLIEIQLPVRSILTLLFFAFYLSLSCHDYRRKRENKKIKNIDF
jgi:hypothetical protein